VTFTDRHGGASRAPYATLNLGDHVGDDSGAVLENRTRAARALDGVPTDPAGWVWLRQVHGCEVVTVDAPPSVPPTADAAVTTCVGLPLVVLTADCAPVALVASGAVAVAHAGWPGLEQGVLGAAVAALRECSDGPIRAVLGPCVHADRYEFGADLLERLVDRLGPQVAARTATGAPALDIPVAVRSALARAGVDDVDDVDVCTAASPQAMVVVRTP
jgi:YfiH family protein